MRLSCFNRATAFDFILNVIDLVVVVVFCIEFHSTNGRTFEIIFFIVGSQRDWHGFPYREK